MKFIIEELTLVSSKMVHPEGIRRPEQHCWFGGKVAKNGKRNKKKCNFEKPVIGRSN